MYLMNAFERQRPNMVICAYEYPWFAMSVALPMRKEWVLKCLGVELVGFNNVCRVCAICCLVTGDLSLLMKEKPLVCGCDKRYSV